MDLVKSSLEDPSIRQLFEREWLADEIVVSIESMMKEKGITRAELAKRLKCKPPNVTQLLRKGTNLKLGSMVDLALAMDCRFLAPQLVSISVPDQPPWYLSPGTAGAPVPQMIALQSPSSEGGCFFAEFHGLASQESTRSVYQVLSSDAELCAGFPALPAS
jgi:transcriptional regulator with XRE-family HTH domain